ncbi:MAG: RNA polymerase sigma factor [Planctomycetota bacterium]
MARLPSTPQDPAAPKLQHTEGTESPCAADDGATAQLIRRHLQGDKSAFTQLYHRKSPWLMLFIERRCAGVCRPEFDAEDICQAVFTRAFRGLAEFSWRRPGSFNAWLGTLARNEIADLGRHLASRGRGKVRHLESDHGQGAPCEPFDPRTTLRTILSRREDVERLRDAAARLPAEEAQVFDLYALEGMSRRAIAAHLGIPKTTVCDRIDRASARIRKWVS